MQLAAVMGQTRGPSVPAAPAGLSISDVSVCVGLGAWRPEADGSWSTPGANVTSVTVVWERPTGTTVRTASLGGTATSDSYVSGGTTTLTSTSVKMTVTFTNDVGSTSTSISSTLNDPC